MPDLTTDCFSLAASIMQQREQEGLLDTLVGILKRELSDCTVTVLNPLSDSETERDAIDSLSRQCLSQREVISDFSRDDVHRYVYPVISVGKVKKLLDIQGPCLADKIVLLEKILDLFSYQHVLLENNNHDALTGLLNRHSFESRMDKITDPRQRRDSEKKTSCFALFDIDFFKNINDTYGHLYGDEVLILFANQMEDTFRHDDMLFRYGGEEFAAVLNNVELEKAIAVLDRFRTNIEHYDFPQIGKVTVSIGVTEISGSVSRLELITRADRALYYSKEHGRNQVNCFDTLLEEGIVSETMPEEQDVELF